MRVRILIMGLLMFASTLASEEKVFQWVDENGTTIYSTQPPPPGIIATETTLKSAPPGTAPSQTLTRDPKADAPMTDRVQAARDREELARKRIKASSYEEALAVECNQAESVIGKLNSPGPIQIADGSGNVRVMDQEERVDRVTLAYEFIRDNCK